MVALVVIALLVPALAYAALIYLLDLHEREPTWALLSCFGLGALAAPLALMLERLLLTFALVPPSDAALYLKFSCFGVIAPAEELSKLLVVLLFARRSLMNEPVDGVVYAGFASLGFAVGEGVLGARGLSPSALALRALLPLPAHVFFSALWGAGLGGVRYWGVRLWPLLALSLVTAIALHGAYDYLLMFDGGAQRGAVVALLSAAGVLCALLFRGLLSASPFRGVTPKAGACAACERPHLALARFCAGCGEPLVAPRVVRLPLDFAATLSSFVGHGALLVLAMLACARLFGVAPDVLWSDALSSEGSALLALLVCVLVAAALPSAWVALLRRESGALDVLVGSAFAWLCTLLYLTLSAPHEVLRALLLLPLSLGCATLVFRVVRQHWVQL